MTIGDIFGLLAGIFTTFAVVPQITKIFKYKSADDISLIFSLMFIVGGLLWLTYGILDRLVPIILWNVTGVTLNLVLLYANCVIPKKPNPDKPEPKSEYRIPVPRT